MLVRVVDLLVDHDVLGSYPFSPPFHPWGQVQSWEKNFGPDGSSYCNVDVGMVVEADLLSQFDNTDWDHYWKRLPLKQRNKKILYICDQNSTWLLPFCHILCFPALSYPVQCPVSSHPLLSFCSVLFVPYCLSCLFVLSWFSLCRLFIFCPVLSNSVQSSPV